MNKTIKSLTVLKGVASDHVVGKILSLYQTDEKCGGEQYAELCYEIYRNNAEDNLLEYVASAVLHDENAFSTRCAANNPPSPYLKSAFLCDLKVVFGATLALKDSVSFNLGCLPSPFDTEDGARLINALSAFYAKNGYGNFIDEKAYKYAEGKLVPISNVSPIRLTDLKGYREEKQAVIDNVGYFLNSLPFSHMLLYGDRGTGKSSTVHAVINEFAHRGLRLIEVDKKDLTAIDAIKQAVAALTLKFIIFIDDLTLSEEEASPLKAAVEGTIVSGSNVMVVATSNRRHVLRESFSDRDDAVHPSDAMEEQLSLSDRFGLTVMFSSTDRQSYLSIVEQLAADLGVNLAQPELFTLAERWAIVKGGRSPRRAKQFVDFAYSCIKSGKSIQF